MKPSPLKESSLWLGAVGGAALAVGSATSFLYNEVFPADYANYHNQVLCVLAPDTADNEQDACYQRPFDSRVVYCNEKNTQDIAQIRDEMHQRQNHIIDKTPFLGKFLGIRIEKNYLPDLKREVSHIEGTTVVSRADANGKTIVLRHRDVQCESLESTLKVSGKPGNQLPDSLPEKVVVAAMYIIEFIVGLLAFILSVRQLGKRKKRKKIEKEADLEKFATLRNKTARIDTKGYRIAPSNNSDVEATRKFLLTLKNEDPEKYYRWIAALEARIAEKSLFFQSIEPSWKEIFKGLTIEQLSQLLAELEPDEEVEENNKANERKRMSR